MEQACRAPLNKALCSVLRISLETSSDVPALLWSPVVQGLLPFNCPCLLMGRGSTQEPQLLFIYLFLHGCHNLYFSASEPSSVFSPKPCRQQYYWFFGLFRRCIWIISSKPRRRYIFDDDLGHGNHSEVLLLFVGCIVNFIVSYLICMFQDSVPAGSYNDPFLSSVWKHLCVKASVCKSLSVCVKVSMCKKVCV